MSVAGALALASDFIDAAFSLVGNYISGNYIGIVEH